MSFRVNHATIKKSGVDGRGLFASKDIPAGDAIFTKLRPLVAILDSARIASCNTCSNCFRVENDPGDLYGRRNIRKCMACMKTAYCNKTCQSAHWKRCHKEICKIARADNDPNLPHILTALVELITMRDKGTITEQEWISVLQLKTNAEAMKSENPKQYKMTSLLAFVASKYGTGVNKYSLDLLSKIACAMFTNCLTLVAPTCDPLGICFDPFLSIANHSCDPNAYVIMDGPEISFRTLKPIKKDEEIFVAYVDSTEPYDKRQRDLKETYFFKCNCSLCVLGAVQDRDKFLKPSAQQLTAAKKLASTVMTKHPEVEAKLKEILGVSTIDIDVHYAEVFDLGIEQELSGAKMASDLHIRTKHLENVLLRCKVSGLYAESRQPCPTAHHQLVLAMMDEANFQMAWTHAVKSYFNIDPIIYPQPHHPLRVVHGFLIVKLGMEVIAEADSSPEDRVLQVLLDHTAKLGLDLPVLLWKVMEEVKKNVVNSHGPSNSWTKTVLEQYDAMRAAFDEKGWRDIQKRVKQMDAPLRKWLDAMEF